TLALDGNAVFQRRWCGWCSAEQFAEECGLGLVGDRFYIAYEICTLAAVPVLNGKACTVQRQANTSPGAVETFIDLYNRLVVDHGDARCLFAGTRSHEGFGLLLCNAELDYHAA